MEASIRRNVIRRNYLIPINEIICILRVRTKFFNMSLINIYAPIEEKEESIEDQFYAKLEQIYDSSPSNDVKIIIGDMNAQIGKEDVFQGTIGAHSLHQISNDNGQRLIDFAMSKNLIISSTFYPRKNIHKQTWVSPDGNTLNQIDHVMIDKRRASRIMNVRMYRGASCGWDHFPVKVVFRRRSTRANKGR